MNRSLPVVLQDGSFTYVYGPGLISMTDGAGVQTYRLTDGLGSTVGLCDGSGTMVATYTYDAFGIIRSSTGSSTNDWLYTGQQRDDESGYDYLRARYYDSQIGRFLGQDPVSPDWKTPATINRFSYALNNPMNLVDPTGLVSQGECTSSSEGWTVCSGIEYLYDGTSYFYSIITIMAEGVGRAFPLLDDSNLDILFELTLAVKYTAAIINVSVTVDVRSVGLEATAILAYALCPALGPIGCPLALLSDGGNFTFEWSDGGGSVGYFDGTALVTHSFNTDNFGGHTVTVSAWLYVVNGNLSCQYSATGIPSVPVLGNLVGLSSNGCY